MQQFSKLCFVIILLILSAIISGFMFMTLWKWFVIPPFHLPSLSLAQAIGLSVFIIYFKMKLKDDDDDDDGLDIEKMSKLFIKGIVTALFVLAISWVIFQFT